MLSFKNFLVELFDKPWNKKFDQHTTNLIKQHLATHPLYKNKSFVNVQAHKLEGNNGHLVSYIHKGMLEVHHLDVDGDSGTVKNHKKINPRFISTFFQHAHEHALSKGKPVRLSMTDDIHSSMHGIISKLAKKHDCSVNHTTSQEGANLVHHLEIKRNMQEQIVGIKKFMEQNNL